jgi:uncharacterized membrane protein YgdD (TMEM256/DUF423 family)
MGGYVTLTFTHALMHLHVNLHASRVSCNKSSNLIIGKYFFGGSAIVVSQEELCSLQLVS